MFSGHGWQGLACLNKGLLKRLQLWSSCWSDLLQLMNKTLVYIHTWHALFDVYIFFFFKAYVCIYPRMVLLSILHQLFDEMPGGWRSGTAGKRHRPSEWMISNGCWPWCNQQKNAPLCHLWQISLYKFRWQLVRVKFLVWGSVRPNMFQKHSTKMVSASIIVLIVLPMIHMPGQKRHLTGKSVEKRGQGMVFMGMPCSGSQNLS